METHPTFQLKKTKTQEALAQAELLLMSIKLAPLYLHIVREFIDRIEDACIKLGIADISVLKALDVVYDNDRVEFIWFTGFEKKMETYAGTLGHLLSMPNKLVSFPDIDLFRMEADMQFLDAFVNNSIYADDDALAKSMKERGFLLKCVVDNLDNLIYGVFVKKLLKELIHGLSINY